ncbi:MAG: sensor histidine kinase [Chitinophagia bacterium]|nr:sensor histidine kinase [Chitinophagia bacterium]
MRKKNVLYWICQAGGWLFYGLTLMFFAFFFNNNSIDVLFPRVGVTIFFGLVSTHFLREFLIRYRLRPPFRLRNWWKYLLSILATILIFNLATSTAVEWLGLYNPATKVSTLTRFVFSLLFDSPLIIVWVSIYFIWHYIDVGAINEIQRVKLQSLVKELELKTIKSHINPHFIFNALNSIRALVDENPIRARTAITELSNILRSSMQMEKAETISLEKELNIVKDYLALEQIRFEDRLQVAYEIDDDTLDQPVPPMMLQTLVENAIKHGISCEKNGGLIRIISDNRGNRHELVVENSGVFQNKISAGKSITSGGFGIESTRHRLKLMYGEKASFDIKNTNNHLVRAEISLPVVPLQILPHT